MHYLYKKNVIRSTKKVKKKIVTRKDTHKIEIVYNIGICCKRDVCVGRPFYRMQRAR